MNKKNKILTPSGKFWPFYFLNVYKFRSKLQFCNTFNQLFRFVLSVPGEGESRRRFRRMQSIKCSFYILHEYKIITPFWLGMFIK